MILEPESTLAAGAVQGIGPEDQPRDQSPGKEEDDGHAHQHRGLSPGYSALK